MFLYSLISIVFVFFGPSLLVTGECVLLRGMMERDQELKCGGHFLIMDTGHGKTVTSLLYAYRQGWPSLFASPSQLSDQLSAAAATSHPISMNVP